MCGIAGLWFQDEINKQILYEYGLKMANSLFKRGPDAGGIWTDTKSGLVFSHRRLSIRDLSQKGAQPMKSHDNNLVIIFNGEIYNFEELKNELNLNKWESNSDTEVLLAAIQEWGLEYALRKSYGMFSFALWNIKENSLVIARDRFGEKPLYWGRLKLKNHQKPILAFASDLSSFWALPGLVKEIEYSAFTSFLKYGYVCGPDSIQKDIYQLNPGHFVKIIKNNESLVSNLPIPKKWWDVKEISSTLFSNQTDNCNTLILEDTLKNIIREQSLADVPSASFLSGGIDSSLIAALLQNQSSKKIRTYNISFPSFGNGEELFNEGPYAKKIADYLGTDHTELGISAEDIKKIIPKIPEIYSEPFADVSQLATSIICKEISNCNIKVALTGDGADELFGGYNRHYYGPFINQKFKHTPFILRKLLAKLILLLPLRSNDLSQEKKRKFVDSILKSHNIESIYESIISNNKDIKSFHKYPEKEQLNFSILNQINAPTLSEKIMFADSISYLPNNILVKLDRAAMNFGLETRAPFLDERIAKIAWGIKLKNKIQNKKFGYTSKSILKKILFKYVPEKYFDRPKKGFSLPIASWLRGPLKEWASDLFEYDLLNKQDYLSVNNVKKIWESHLKGNSENTELIWTLLMWQSWLEKWK